jgi:hypothetical protein
MHNILFFSRFVFDEFIAKGGEYGHKLVELLANRVVERRKMILSIFGGELTLRVVGRVHSGGVFSELFVFLSFS